MRSLTWARAGQGAMALAGTLCPLLALAAATRVEVTQLNRMFSTQALEIARGTLVQFSNRDSFPHQVHVSGPNLLFDSGLQDAGEQTGLVFPDPGVFQVRCGIHPRMRLTVTVRADP